MTYPKLFNENKVKISNTLLFICLNIIFHKNSFLSFSNAAEVFFGFNFFFVDPRRKIFKHRKLNNPQEIYCAKTIINKT